MDDLSPRAAKIVALSLFALVLMIGIPGGSGLAQSPRVPETGVERLQRLATYDDILATAAKADDFVGLAVTVVDRGQVVLTRTYGHTDRTLLRPVDPQTVFRLASLSKGISATVASLLVAEGKIDYGATLDRFPVYPKLYRGAEKQATVEHLLSHRLGLPPNAYDNMLEAGRPTDFILERLGGVKPICRVGDCYGYQNVAFNTIETIIAEAEGQAFAAAVRDRLFTPLGMERALVGPIDQIGDDNWARPHVLTRAGWVDVEVDNNYYRVPAAGGMNASITDMARWLNAQLGHAPEVLPARVLADVHTPRVRTTRELYSQRWRRARLQDAHYGLGWRIYDYEGERLVYHAGGVRGYRAQIAMLPDHDLGIVILWNSEGRRGWRLLPAFLDLYMDLDDPDWLDLQELEKQLALEAAQEAAQTQPSSGSP